MKKSRILINALLITIFLLSACSSPAAAISTGSSSASSRAENEGESVNSPGRSGAGNFQRRPGLRGCIPSGFGQ